MTRFLSTAILVGGAIALLATVPGPAHAQCVGADTSVQANISGNPNTQRSNDVAFETSGSCRGNAISTSGVQVNVGGNGPVRQERRVRQRFEGNNEGSSNGPTVTVNTNVGVDVYNAADNLNRSNGEFRNR
ncbi:MAG: hypothetical protein AAFY11_01185 [Cyanobacteria bacterium J06641_5]